MIKQMWGTDKGAKATWMQQADAAQPHQHPRARQAWSWSAVGKTKPSGACWRGRDGGGGQWVRLPARTKVVYLQGKSKAGARRSLAACCQPVRERPTARAQANLGFGSLGSTRRVKT